jgi:hypothetical protein
MKRRFIRGGQRRPGGRVSSGFTVEIIRPGYSDTTARVADLSTEGARLVVPTRFRLPQEFELRLDQRTYFVRLVKHWHRSAVVRFKDRLSKAT